ncbi:MAG: replication initiator protein A [Blastocatellia bacterium]|nr:replication initiator protein A [Blastocatellia bacterium]
MARKKTKSPDSLQPSSATPLFNEGSASSQADDFNEGDRNEQIRISQDEFNLAVFPIAVLDKRAQKITSYLKFAENITSNGREITRTWTVLAHPIEGLPSTTDEDVYVALMELSHEQGGSKKVYFSRYDLIRRLGWPMNAKHYERLESSLRKLAAVRIEAKNAYLDPHTNKLVDVGMAIIQEFKIFDETMGKKGESKSYILWSDRVAQSFNEKLFKKLDAGFYFTLTSPIAKRMFRYLDKKFGAGDYFVINAKKLAFEHLGMSRDLNYVSQIVQRIEPSIEELVEKGFLADWKLTEETLHFHKNPKFGARIQQLSLPLYSAVEDMQEDDLTPEERAYHDLGGQLAGQLAARGMIGTVAQRLVESMLQQGRLDFIENTIAYFDKHYRNRKLNNPGGFLYTLIVNGPPVRDKETPTEEAPARKTAAKKRLPEVPALFETASTGRLGLQDLELGYIDYLEQTGDYLLGKLKKTELKDLIEQERATLLASDKRRIYERWSTEVLTEHLRRLVGRNLASQQAMSFAEWCAKQGYDLRSEADSRTLVE